MQMRSKPMPGDTATVIAYVALGSNLADPQGQVRRALAELDEMPRTRCVARSGLYRSSPMGPSEQPDFVNAVAALRTSLTALALLDELQRLERRHGRVRGPVRWGPRTLDLDLLWYADRIIDHPRLQVPHPGIAARRFVLQPLAEIAPDLHVPGQGPIVVLLARCPGDALVKIPAP